MITEYEKLINRYARKLLSVCAVLANKLKENCKKWVVVRGPSCRVRGRLYRSTQDELVLSCDKCVCVCTEFTSKISTYK